MAHIPTQCAQSTPKLLVPTITRLLLSAKDRAKDLAKMLLNGAIRIVQKVHNLEQLFIKVNFAYTIFCQMIFFIMLDIALLNDTTKDQRSTPSAAALMVYTLMTFFITRMKQVIENTWPNVTRDRNLLRPFLECIWKLFLELCKATSVFVCLKNEKSISEITFVYGLITFSYYITTENVFLEMFTNFVNSLNCPEFDEREHLWVPMILKSYALLSAVLLSGRLIFRSKPHLVVMGSYFIIYLRFKELYFNYVKMLTLEKKLYESFKVATEEEIKQFDDICAICLCHMDEAKVTSCQHLFHSLCLKQCLKQSLRCPICKQEFK
ncbi:hypothetical protein FQA39_LY09854 [Lamprigera yunnana]|nr:hypothetical protein FQA39_LY09854 [Lamprigera yunnana]